MQYPKFYMAYNPLAIPEMHLQEAVLHENLSYIAGNHGTSIKQDQE